MNRSLSFRGLLFALAVCFAAAAPACGRQGEGERCVVENGSEDCDSNLVCVPGSELGQSSDVCCPESGNSTDKRCNKIVGTGGEGGGTTTTSATATTSATTSSSTTSAGGGGTGGAGGAGGTGGTGGAGGTGGM